MRARTAAAAALSLMVACTGGTRGSGPATSVTQSPAASTVPSVPVSTAPTTTAGGTPILDPSGSVTLSAGNFELPAGGGLRVIVRASPARLTVRRRGGGAALLACPVGDATTPAVTARCSPVDGTEGVVVALPGDTAGVELRPATGGAAVDEVSVTWAPLDRSVTLVTPARAAGACAANPCEATFGLTPPRAGSFSLDARGAGGRPRLTLQGVPNSGSIRTLATVEGGGGLSIRATLDAFSEAVLLYREAGADAVSPLAMQIFWP